MFKFQKRESSKIASHTKHSPPFNFYDIEFYRTFKIRYSSNGKKICQKKINMMQNFRNRFVQKCAQKVRSNVLKMYSNFFSFIRPTQGTTAKIHKTL